MVELRSDKSIILELVDDIFEDPLLNTSQKIQLIRERKLKMYYNLKYHNLTKEMRKDVKGGIKYMEDKIRLLKEDSKLNKLN